MNEDTRVELIEKPNGFLRIKDLNPENRKTSDLTKTGKKYLADKLADIRLRTSNSNNFSSFMERKDSSRSRIEMGGPRCKMFNHDAMSGAREAKVLFGTYSHMQKVQNWGHRGHGSWIHY